MRFHCVFDDLLNFLDAAVCFIDVNTAKIEYNY